MGGGAGMVQKIIIALTIVAIVVLYRGMQHELHGPRPIDARGPLNLSEVLASIQAAERTCDAIDSFVPLGQSNLSWDAYLARCHDGGRYVFFQDAKNGRLDVKSCAEEAELGYRCPR
jgi:hypothetical protein